MVFDRGLFVGKTVLVTGAGTGIGRAVALAFGELGATVVLAGRRREPLEQTARLIAELGVAGAEGLVHTLDIRDPEAVEAVVEAVVAHTGRIDVLVNNAGGNFVSPALGMSPKGWRAVIDINLNGTFHMCRAVGPRMAADGLGGRIINMSATNGEGGSPLMAHSGASKAGMNSLTQTLAVEWGALGITVNAILPGPVRTEGSDERLWLDASVVQKLESRIPLGRFGRPEDIAPVAVFLASPGGAFITGALVVVDGGDALRTPPFG